MLSDEVASAIEESCKDRAKIYTFLSRMFERELTAELIEEMRCGQSPLRGKPSGEIRYNMMLHRGIELIGDYLNSIQDRKLEDVQEEMAAEYAGLFLGVRGVPLHPSESLYIGKEKLIMQEPREEVLAVYRQEGLGKIKQFTEPEDHVAIELHFMALLCERCAASAKAREFDEMRRLIQMQQEFLRDHLARWLPSLSQDVERGSHITFYDGVAKFATGYVELDKEVLESIGELLR